MRKLPRPSSGAVAFDCGSTRSLQLVPSSSLVRMGWSRASAGESSPAGLRTTVGSGFAHGGFSHGVSWACEDRGRDGERKRARREGEGAGAGTGAGVGSGEALAAGKGGLDLGADEAGADFGSGRKAKAETAECRVGWRQRASEPAWRRERSRVGLARVHSFQANAQASLCSCSRSSCRSSIMRPHGLTHPVADGASGVLAGTGMLRLRCRRHETRSSKA